MQNTANIDILRVERGMRITRNPKAKFVAQDKIIQTAWRNLGSNRISVREFIENSLHFVDGIHSMFNMWIDDGHADGKTAAVYYYFKMVIPSVYCFCGISQN